MKRLLIFLFLIIALTSYAQMTVNLINQSPTAVGVQIWALGSGYPDGDRGLIWPNPSGVYIVPAYTNISLSLGDLAFRNSANNAYVGTVYMTTAAITSSSASGAQVQSWSFGGFPGTATGSSTATFYVTGSPATYTNYTFSIMNFFGVQGTATWTYNGAVVQTETLNPLQSGSWTTPPLEVSPVAEIFTMNYGITPVGNSIGYNPDGSPNFTGGGSGGGGVSGTASGSGGSLTSGSTSGSGTSSGGGQTATTNGLSLSSGTNSEISIGTNIVSWTPPSGAASESTAEEAATLAHTDSQNLLQGLSIINSSINNNFQMTTNELGQLVGLGTSNNVLGFNADTYLASINTNIAREIQIASTNGQFVIQSNTAINVTNVADVNFTNYAQETTLEGVSNVLAAHFGTNDSVYTNYAEESTLEGMSNLMAQMLVTNSTPPDTNAMLAAGEAYAEQGSNLIMSLSDGVPTTPANAADMPMGANGMNWTVQIPLPMGGSYSADLNPFDVSWVQTLAAFVRSLVKWILIAGLLMSNINELSAALRSMGSTRQASASGQSEFGTNLNGLTAAIMAGSITIVMLAVPAFAVASFIGYLSDFSANPFVGVSGLVGTAVWMCDQFLPLAVMVACVFCYYTFRVSLDATVWAVQTLTRFLVG